MGLLTVVVVLEFWDSKKGFAISDCDENISVSYIIVGRGRPVSGIKEQQQCLFILVRYTETSAVRGSFHTQACSR